MLKTLLVLLATTWTLSCAAQSCGGELRGAQTVQSAHYVVAYRMQPAKIAVGRHFSIDFVTCARGDAPAPAAVAVDAYMPEHGHGMNYKASVKRADRNQAVVKPAENQDKAALKPAAKSSGARFRADGLMFHMPGRWDLSFDVQGAGTTERLTRSIVLE